MNDPTVFFGFSFRHHGPHTAFRGLARALSDQTVIDASPPWPSWTPRALEWRLNWRWLCLAEHRLKNFYRRDHRQVIHYFFPENTMYHAHEWKRHHRLVATCHQPVERINRPRDDDSRYDRFISGIRACDVVVVQCQSHIGPYRHFLPGARVENIPLGVDTDFFRPRGEVSRGARPRVLTVGNWLRDYATWAETVRQLHHRGCDADFIVIANRDTQERARRELGPSRARVTYMTGLSDEALRDEYEKADVFYLPLTDAMANDALLEGLAMGSFIIVTDLPATRDYAGDTAVYVPRGGADAAADAIAARLAAAGSADANNQSARARAERLFAWPIIADQYRAIYGTMRTA
jgi:glycosyltransferase involved in cell wall biosynthesis